LASHGIEIYAKVSGLSR